MRDSSCRVCLIRALYSASYRSLEKLPTCKSLVFLRPEMTVSMPMRMASSLVIGSQLLKGSVKKSKTKKLGFTSVT